MLLLGLEYLQEAAAANNTRAKEFLLAIYAQGLYVRPDAEKAKYWKDS